MSKFKAVHIIFAQEVQPLNGTSGERFKDVTFHDVYAAHREPAGLVIQFEPTGAHYVYPWHTLARIKFIPH